MGWMSGSSPPRTRSSGNRWRWGEFRRDLVLPAQRPLASTGPPLRQREQRDLAPTWLRAASFQGVDGAARGPYLRGDLREGYADPHGAPPWPGMSGNSGTWWRAWWRAGARKVIRPEEIPDEVRRGSSGVSLLPVPLSGGGEGRVRPRCAPNWSSSSAPGGSPGGPGPSSGTSSTPTGGRWSPVGRWGIWNPRRALGTGGLPPSRLPPRSGRWGWRRRWVPWTRRGVDPSRNAEEKGERPRDPCWKGTRTPGMEKRGRDGVVVFPSRDDHGGDGATGRHGGRSGRWSGNRRRGRPEPPGDRRTNPLPEDREVSTWSCLEPRPPPPPPGRGSGPAPAAPPGGSSPFTPRWVPRTVLHPEGLVEVQRHREGDTRPSGSPAAPVAPGPTPASRARVAAALQVTPDATRERSLGRKVSPARSAEEGHQEEGEPGIPPGEAMGGGVPPRCIPAQAGEAAPSCPGR